MAGTRGAVYGKGYALEDESDGGSILLCDMVGVVEELIKVGIGGVLDGPAGSRKGQGWVRVIEREVHSGS